MRLALTGITSGVGMRLAEVARERGDTIAGLVRDPQRQDAQRLAGAGVRLVRGDLDDRAALDDLCRDADVVVHLAAQVGDSGPREQFERVNVGGTRNVVEAAAAARASRLVHLSSVAVYGRPDRGRVTEEWPTRKIGLPYEDTKTDGEALAFGRGRELGLPVVSLRPPIIYGPHDRNFLPRMLTALRAGRFLLIDGGDAPLNVVWVDHVVDVILAAAERDGVAGEAFNVMDEVDAAPPTVRQVGETVAAAAGMPPPRRSIPYPVAMGLGYLLHGAYRLVGARSAPPVSPFVVKIMTRHVIYDASKAVRVLGWRPKIHALEGLARTAREMVAAGA